MSKRAVILAGGKGTRLKPYTISFPKPLVPVGNMPIIEIIIRQLANSGFDHITITVNHLAEIIKAFCETGKKWNIKIDYTFEDKPLSTMGPLKLIHDLPENFLVMNGDVLTDLDFGRFHDTHADQKNQFTISAFDREQKVDFGVLETDENILTGFKEKPVLHYRVSMGAYMLNRNIVKLIPPDIPFGFDDLMHKMVEKNLKVNVLKHSGYWLDIGRPDDYEQAVYDYENKKFQI